jgi:hypothetical protein
MVFRVLNCKFLESSLSVWRGLTQYSSYKTNLHMLVDPFFFNTKRSVDEDAAVVL